METLDFEFNDQEQLEDFSEYATYKLQEAVTGNKVSAADLPTDIKESMGLNIFPEDIQNDILNLAQKIADLGIETAQRSNLEDFIGQQRVTGFRGCLNNMPYRDIYRDSSRTFKTTRTLLNAVPTFHPWIKGIKAFGPIVTASTKALAAGGGWAVGCYQRHR